MSRFIEKEKIIDYLGDLLSSNKLWPEQEDIVEQIISKIEVGFFDWQEEA